MSKTAKVMADLRNALASDDLAQKVAAAEAALWYVTGCRTVLAEGERLHLVFELVRERTALESLQEMARVLGVCSIPTVAVLPPVATTEGTWRAVIVL